MKKLALFTLGMLILFAFLLGTSTLYGVEHHTDGSSTVLSADLPEESNFPFVDHINDKYIFSLSIIILIAFTRFWINKILPITVTSSRFAFLTAMFFQSNYVIKPLRL